MITLSYIVDIAYAVSMNSVHDRSSRLSKIQPMMNGVYAFVPRPGVVDSSITNDVMRFK